MSISADECLTGQLSISERLQCNAGLSVVMSSFQASSDSIDVTTTR